MKFLTFESNAEQRLGVVVQDSRVADLTSILMENAIPGMGRVPRSVFDVITLPEDQIQCLLDASWLSRVDANQLPSLDEVAVLAPLSLDRNVFCVGRNYREHIIEGNLARGRPANTFPEAIEFFTKSRTTVVGHGAPVKRHATITNSLDYEAELAIVIGKRGTNIRRDQALDHVFGYTIVNDITARDLQALHGQWFKGKSLDTTCPMGPVVVHKSAITNPNNLIVELSLNGEQRQRDNTSGMIFDVQAIIEQLSAGLTLEPGDVIATGTPKGVGFARNPPRCLEIGDLVSASVEGIGTLTNRIAP